ncbi:uncharacterized protein LOC134806748 [Cydia splendana]|uniref:uncharacterized protein LOC134806748 n=1 Tax=Cydia splendana TaxID=1100963 RepID=UPI00300CE842
MPTSAHKEEEIEDMYEQLDELLRSVKSEHNLYILGDFNAVVGDIKDGDVTGKWGLGNRNERGERLINFCKQYDLYITNTMFEMPKRRRYTWKMPGDIARFQIDYIIARTNSKKHIRSSHAYPGPNIDSDHNLVLAKCEIEWPKNHKNKTKKLININLERLKNLEYRKEYKETTDRILQEWPTPEGTLEGQWKTITKTIEKASSAVLGKTKRAPRKNWITQEILDLILLRNKYRDTPTEEGQNLYRKYKNRIQTLCVQQKEKWLDAQCSKIDFCMQRGFLERRYNLVKTLQGKKKTKSKVISNKEGKLLYDKEDVVGRWVEYIEELYEGTNLNGDILEEEEKVPDDSKGPNILWREFDSALEALADKKAPGKDNVPAELLKCCGPEAKNYLYNLISTIYDTGQVPEEFSTIKTITIPKKDILELSVADGSLLAGGGRSSSPSFGKLEREQPAALGVSREGPAW